MVLELKRFKMMEKAKFVCYNERTDWYGVAGRERSLKLAARPARYNERTD